MKFLITITLFIVLALKTSNAQDGPCLPTRNPYGYGNFLKHHILPAGFDINAKDRNKKFAAHIKKIGRCDIEFQSFVHPKYHGKVEQICNGHGKTLAGNYARDLCISDNNIPIIHVRVNTKTCKVRSLDLVQEKVIVACDIFENRCVPVHFEGNTGQTSDNNSKVCKP